MKTKVLVITDTQVDFITGVLGNEECRAVIPRIVKRIETENYDAVIVTQDTHDDNYLQTQEGKKLPVLHTQKNTPGWEVVPEIVTVLKKKYQTGDAQKVFFIEKPTFGGERVMNKIKDFYDIYGDKLQIDFVGVCTGICVISNVLLAKTAAPEAEIRVIADACADVTPADHKTAIAAMRHCQVDIIE